MVTQTQVAHNAKVTALQIVVSSVVLLFLYRYLVRFIGIDAVGVWSVVLATTSAGRLADLGVTGSTTRFVARALAQQAPHAAADYAQTAALSAAAIYLVIALIAYPALRMILKVVVPESHFEQAMMLVPYALVSFWLGSVATVLQGAIDGTQRIDLKGYLIISSSLLYLAAALAMVPRAGLIGLARAQVLQSTFLLVSSWLLLRRCLSSTSLLPSRWRYTVFREIVGFGSQLQILSLMVILFEPVTKAFLARFGGLTVTGYYELATRMVQQVRAVLVNANQVLVPTIADLQERDSDKVSGLYGDSYRIMVYLSLPTLAGLVAIIPLTSEWWLGRYEPQFVLFAILLAIGWFTNILSAPAYFVGVGTGQLRWNLLGHVTTAVLNVLLGAALGVIWGGVGVVVGAVSALMIGSLVVAVRYQVQQGGRLSALFPRESWELAAGSVVAAVGALLTYGAFRFHAQWGLGLVAVMVMLVLLAPLAHAVWTHPLRRRLVAWALESPERAV